ncbi:hypothetical protein LY76DRAFT_346191 [Colletotrichum caudatum]|nr:hypothetical protein LY76DRAFT_346191 [Colletotrichum caudatum]
MFCKAERLVSRRGGTAGNPWERGYLRNKKQTGQFTRHGSSETGRCCRSSRSSSSHSSIPSVSWGDFDFTGALKKLLRGLRRWIGCRGRVFGAFHCFSECTALFGPWTSTTADGRQDEAYWKQGTTHQLKATSPHLNSTRLHNSPSDGRQSRRETDVRRLSGCLVQNPSRSALVFLFDFRRPSRKSVPSVIKLRV